MIKKRWPTSFLGPTWDGDGDDGGDARTNAAWTNGTGANAARANGAGSDDARSATGKLVSATTGFADARSVEWELTMSMQDHS